MRKIMMILASSALVLGVVLGVLAWQGQAAAQDAPSLHALKNQSPIVKLAACNGYTGGLFARLVGSAPAVAAAAVAFPVS